MITNRPTVDVVVVVADRDLILIRRGKEPFKGMLAFPGGHVEAGESLAVAAARELREEINLTIDPAKLKRFLVLDGPGRDPRPGHTKSTVFELNLADETLLGECRAGDDAAEFTVRELDSILPEEMAFDHFSVISRLKDRR